LCACSHHHPARLFGLASPLLLKEAGIYAEDVKWYLKPEWRLLYFSGSRRGAKVHFPQLTPGKQQFTKGPLKMGTRPSEGDG